MQYLPMPCNERTPHGATIGVVTNPGMDRASSCVGDVVNYGTQSGGVAPGGGWMSLASSYRIERTLYGFAGTPCSGSATDMTAHLTGRSDSVSTQSDWVNRGVFADEVFVHV